MHKIPQNFHLSLPINSLSNLRNNHISQVPSHPHKNIRQKRFQLRSQNPKLLNSKSPFGGQFYSVEHAGFSHHPWALTCGHGVYRLVDVFVYLLGSPGAPGGIAGPVLELEHGRFEFEGGVEAADFSAEFGKEAALNRKVCLSFLKVEFHLQEMWLMKR